MRWNLKTAVLALVLIAMSTCVAKERRDREEEIELSNTFSEAEPGELRVAEPHSGVTKPDTVPKGKVVEIATGEFFQCVGSPEKPLKLLVEGYPGVFENFVLDDQLLWIEIERQDDAKSKGQSGALLPGVSALLLKKIGPDAVVIEHWRGDPSVYGFPSDAREYLLGAKERAIDRCLPSEPDPEETEEFEPTPVYVAGVGSRKFSISIISWTARSRIKGLIESYKLP